jgi:hypothetical protein
MEIWKPLDFTGNNYEVSSEGRVRSVFKIIIRKTGNKHTRKSKVLRPSITKKGYHQVALSFNDKLVAIRVHRLVAHAFIPNPESKEHVNHKNGIKTDNSVENLEWATHKENVAHAIDNGLFIMKADQAGRDRSINKTIKKGSLNGFSKLTEDKVREIRQKYIPRVYTREQLATEYNVTISAIKDVLIRKSWKHVL